MRLLNILLLATAAMLQMSPSAAQSEDAAPRTIRIVGRPQITVTTNTVRLDDVSEISSPESSDDEAIIALKKISIVESPRPGRTTNLSALDIVQRMRAARVDLSRVGYTFPTNIVISRAGRTVTLDEVRSAIEAQLTASNIDASLKSVSYNEDVQIAPGVANIEALLLANTAPGQMSYAITVRVPGEPETKFRVTALADQWREVAVAARPVPKGGVIAPQDVMMARLNLASLPRDSAESFDTVVGYATNNAINAGEVFQRAKLLIPPVILAGAPVTMQYRTASFEATATGTAMQPGAMGEEIRIRNDSSKKIVVGTVVDTGLVRVSAPGGAR